MIYLGADHGGYELKEKLKEWLTTQGKPFTDLGAMNLDPGDDYPQYASSVATKVAMTPQSVGILVCRSGAGMAIAANKIAGIRAVVVQGKEEAVHAREHNDANVLVLSADWLDVSQATAIVDVFLETTFPEDERHVRRLAQIASMEAR